MASIDALKKSPGQPQRSLSIKTSRAAASAPSRTPLDSGFEARYFAKYCSTVDSRALAASLRRAWQPATDRILLDYCERSTRVAAAKRGRTDGGRSSGVRRHFKSEGTEARNSSLWANRCRCAEAEVTRRHGLEASDRDEIEKFGGARPLRLSQSWR